MHHVYHAYRKNKKNPSHKKLSRFIEMLVYFLGPFSVVIFFPQLFKIWIDHETAGVSVLSWIGLLGANIFWMIYGIIHSERPIIFINFLGGLVISCIILGVFIFSR